MSGATEEYKQAVKDLYKKSQIVLTDEELESVDYADFGLDNLEEEGLNSILCERNGFIAKSNMSRTFTSRLEWARRQTRNVSLSLGRGLSLCRV